MSKTDAGFERRQAMLREALPDVLRTLAEIAAGSPSRAQRAAQRALERYLKAVGPCGPKQ